MEEIELSNKIISVDIAYENLANAIIERAVQDYRDALANKAEGQAKLLEKFFRSPWYHILTNVDGEYIINRVRAEHQAKINKRRI